MSTPTPSGCPECGRDIDQLGGNPECPVCAAEPKLGPPMTPRSDYVDVIDHTLHRHTAEGWCDLRTQEVQQ